MKEMGPQFAHISNEDFVNYLKEHAIKPTEAESNSLPQGEIQMHHGIEETILESPGQRFGWSATDFPSK